MNEDNEQQLVIIDMQSMLEISDPRRKDGIPSMHFLVVCKNIPDIELVVKCGGSIKPEIRKLNGFYIPMILNPEIPLKHGNDHYAGCSKLNHSVNPTLVESFAAYLNTLFNNKSSKMYLDTDLMTISVDNAKIDELREGIIPVIITGISPYTKFKFSDTAGYIITGNCV